MQQVIAWLPQLVITLIPGLVNVWLSGGAQRKEFQQKLPIFKPTRSPIWWILQLVHFLVPALLFWWVAPNIFRIPPPTLTRALNFELWANALAFGWGFVALLNAPISILSAGMLEPGTMYTKLVKNLYEAIDNNEQPKMRRFRRELEAELAQTPNFSDKGFNDLCECLKIPYNFLSEGESTLDAEKAALVGKIKAIQSPQKTQAQQAEAIVKLLRTTEVLATQDWPELIRAFGGREAFIQRYFKVRTKTSPKARPPQKGSRSRS